MFFHGTTVRDILAINRLPQTIRDECQGDWTTTRQTFINIRIDLINLYSGTTMQYTGQHSGLKTIDTHMMEKYMKLCYLISLNA